MRTAVLLSGGVDSALALHLLRKRDDHQITAFYLKIWLEDELSFLGDCPWEEDLRYVRACCQLLDVPLEIVPLQAAYREQVVEYALAELRRGNTPSPDIFCNRRIKFGAFLDLIGPSFDRVATGHYARRLERDGRVWLGRSPDRVKDQTYFLSRLHQAQLARACFPLGQLTKAQVRTLAARLELPPAHRPDSQGICFLGKIPYREFIEFHLGEQVGAIRERKSGRILGQHRGHWFFTIGQRFGLGLGGGPWFVTEKDVDTNTIFVAHRDDRPLRQRSTFTADRVNWITAPPQRNDLTARLRHGPELLRCRIADGDAGAIQVSLEQPDSGIAPGQHVVLYDGDICLGGAIIRGEPRS